MYMQEVFKKKVVLKSLSPTSSCSALPMHQSPPSSCSALEWSRVPCSLVPCFLCPNSCIIILLGLHPCFVGAHPIRASKEKVQWAIHRFSPWMSGNVFIQCSILFESVVEYKIFCWKSSSEGVLSFPSRIYFFPLRAPYYSDSGSTVGNLLSSALLLMFWNARIKSLEKDLLSFSFVLSCAWWGLRSEHSWPRILRICLVLFPWLFLFLSLLLSF